MGFQLYCVSKHLQIKKKFRWQPTLKELNVTIFTSLRCMILVATLIPITLVIDRKFVFAELYAKETKQEKIPTTTLDHPKDDDEPSPSAHDAEDSPRELQPTTKQVQLPLAKRIAQFVWNRLPSWRDHLWFALCGALVVVVNQVLFALGLYMTRSPFLSSIVQQVVPVYVCIMSLIAKYEKVSWIKFIGIGCAVLGAVLTILMNNMTSFSSFNFDTQTLIGIGCLLVNSLAYAFYLIAQKRLLLRGLPPCTVTMWSFAYGVLFITAISFVFYKDFHPLQISGPAWFGIVFGMFIYNVTSNRWNFGW